MTQSTTPSSPPSRSTSPSPGPPGTTAGSRDPRRARWLVGTGATLVVVAVVFLAVGVPAVVRLPLNTDQTVHYTGTFTEYVNPQTALAISHPVTVPLTVDRRVRVVSGSFSTAVVTERNTIKAGPLTYHQNFQYVIDRRTMAFENGPQTQMFDQRAPIPIAGTYRVNFPLGTKASGRYPVFNTETDKSSVVSHGSGPKTMAGVSGVQVIDFTSDVTGPVSPFYHQWLVHNGFPASISPTQLAPRLAAMGVDITSLLASLLPHLTSAQQAQVMGVLSQPVPLNYTYFYRGIVAVEPHTGILIWVDTTAEGLNVAPSLAGVDRLQPLLTEYASLPGVAQLSSALHALQSAPPQPAVDYTWVQTTASARHMASLARSQIRLMDLVVAVPWVVGAAGLILILAGLEDRVRHARRPHPAAAQPTEQPGQAAPPADGGPLRRVA